MEISKKSLRYGLFIFVIILIFIAFGLGDFFATGNAISKTAANSDVQIVKLKVVGANYVLEPSTIRKDVPVRIEADMNKVLGCARSIVIPGFNVRKTVTSTDNIIEFTPTKSGTFNIACSMNMYVGTFKVLDSNGGVASYVEPVKSGSGSCGSEGGGCGCGG